MERKDDREDGSSKVANLLNLPVELLVYIFSFLSTVRDKVKLRYVSRTLRVVSETPSLWRVFVWPFHDHREERSGMNALKTCGGYVKRLVLPDHVIQIKLFQMMILCSNVEQLSLPLGTVNVDLDELRLAVQHMEHLEKLEVQLSTDIKPLLQIGGLKELTVHVPKQHHSLCVPWVEEWMRNKFIPFNLNIMTEMFEVETETDFIDSVLKWNFTPLTNYASFLKLYYSFRTLPLNLYPSLPEFQAKFGLTVTLPFLKASTFGILGLSADIFTLTERTCNGRTFCKMESESHGVSNVFHDNNNSILLNPLNSLRCVTEFNFVYTESLHSGHLEQLAIACPNLQRLNLENNFDCLASLQGLRTISQHCRDLCGLNLRYISADYTESHIGVWEIISGMKLTHLLIDVCMYYPLKEIDPLYDQQLVGFFQKCFLLKALQLDYLVCELCEEVKVNWTLLSYFPALRYCYFNGNQPSAVQDVLNTCRLSILWCKSYECLIISSISTANLQQFFIDANITNIPDIFMETVSAHGGLVHVALSVNSVTVQGVTTLVTNSPQLLTLHLWCRELVCCKYAFNAVTSRDELKQDLQNRFPSRKLFTTAGCINFFCSYEFIHGTDMFPLWPSYRSF